MTDEGAWFAPKRFGYGAGLPIRRQGWVLLLGFLILLVVGGLTLRGHPVASTVLLIAATGCFVIVVRRRTRGGWRWRWGE